MTARRALAGVGAAAGALAAASLAVCCLAAPARAQSDERILSFASAVTVSPDASLEVRETIRVRAAGGEIRHGIYRDFPTRYRISTREWRTVTFEVAEIRRDGVPEPWHTARRSNGVRVYVGDPQRFVEPGEHTYLIAYRTRRQLGFFADHDELFWNVTGNGWDFPIDEASVTVRLPAGVPWRETRLAAYTGPEGARGQAYAASRSPDDVTFRTTTPLGAHEGLTAVVGWPKGFVREPTRAERVGWALDANRGAAVGLLGLFVVFAYYVVVWSRVGRDPERGFVPALSEPPEGLSPAAVRYLRRMRFDTKAFAATLVHLAVQGNLVIEERGGVFTLRRTPGSTKLAPEEASVMLKLFGAGQEVELRPASHARVGAALDALRTSLRARLEKTSFNLNRGHLAAGVGLSAGVALLMLLADHSEQAAVSGFLSLWLLLWTLGTGLLVTRVASAWRDAIAVPGRRAARIAGALFLSLFAVPFVGAEIVVLGILFVEGSAAYAVILLLLAGLTLLFSHLLKAPTAAGRRLLDAIEGFEQYVAAAESARFVGRDASPSSPGLFEKILPYAIALDLEQRWSERFAAAVGRVALAGAGGGARPGLGGYAPGWYASDAGHGGWEPSTFASALGGGLSGAISSSSTAPGSSSGGRGGGGGSSGGGGGGGGGGGW